MSEISRKTYEASLAYFLRPIRDFLDGASDVTEIMINGPAEIYIERQGRLEKTTAAFSGSESLLAAVTNIAQFTGRQIRAEEPRFDARLPEGHRVHVVLPPLCRNGISVTIRKHTKGSLRLADLIAKGSIAPEAAEHLGECIHQQRNLIVSGGTGTGKTTLLNAFSALIPAGERIVVIEDSAELQIQQEHVVSLETRPPDRKGRGAVTIRDLLHSALRMRPDRIVIGECRGGEAFDLLQAMNTGHAGSMSTVHANTPREALKRLETLALLGGVEAPLPFLRAQVAAAIHVVVQLQRLAGRRLVQSIAACEGLDESGDYRTVELFTWDLAAGALRRTPAAEPYLRSQGASHG
jgi:pilus assembly protein CpaF